MTHLLLARPRRRRHPRRQRVLHDLRRHRSWRERRSTWPPSSSGRARPWPTSPSSSTPPTEQRRWSDAAAAARATAESTLWIESGGYYRLDTGGPFSVRAAGRRAVRPALRARDGLPDVLDPQRMASHLAQAYRLNVLGVADAQMGASNMVDPSGEPVATPQAQGGVARGHVLHRRAHAHRGPSHGTRPTSSPPRSPPGTACTAPPTTTTARRSGSTLPPCGSPSSPLRTGPPRTSAAGRPGSCSWRSRTRSRPGGRPPV